MPTEMKQLRNLNLHETLLRSLKLVAQKLLIKIPAIFQELHFFPLNVQPMWLQLNSRQSLQGNPNQPQHLLVWARSFYYTFKNSSLYNENISVLSFFFVTQQCLISSVVLWAFLSG